MARNEDGEGEQVIEKCRNAVNPNNSNQFFYPVVMRCYEGSEELGVIIFPYIPLRKSPINGEPCYSGSFPSICCPSVGQGDEARDSGGGFGALDLEKLAEFHPKLA